MPAISADVGEWSHAVFFSSIAVIRAAGHGQMESGIDRRLLADQRPITFSRPAVHPKEPRLGGKCRSSTPPVISVGFAVPQPVIGSIGLETPNCNLARKPNFVE